jgi:butyryl-CoA dehydrogenase
MLFELTEEEKLIQAAAARFAKQELEPAAAELDRTKNRDILLTNLKKLAELSRYPSHKSEEAGRARFYGCEY